MMIYLECVECVKKAEKAQGHRNLDGRWDQARQKDRKMMEDAQAQHHQTIGTERERESETSHRHRHRLDGQKQILRGTRPQVEDMPKVELIMLHAGSGRVYLSAASLHMWQWVQPHGE